MSARPASSVAGSLALYVHWPFCLAKCPYCDFNSHVRDAIDQDRWRAALLRELDHWAERTGPRRIGSIFFGGGTPSLMDPETVAGIVDAAGSRWTLAGDAEVTLEANPTSSEAARFRDFRTAGVNRVSLGVQALDDCALAFLGRGHSAAEALAAAALAARIFPRHSIDLIYARPGQTPEAWRAELARALDHVRDHVSAYQLTIEKGTPFFTAHRRGDFALPDEDAAVALYEVTQDVLGSAGLAAYEISNHARPGGECRHNLTYWRYEDYAGIGPGAHGRLADGRGAFAVENLRAPERWLEQVEGFGHGTAAQTALSEDEAREEAAMMGLRLAEGLDRGRVRRRFGIAVEDLFDRDRLAVLVDAGFIETDDVGLHATAAGRQRLNAVIAHLLSGVSSSGRRTPEAPDRVSAPGPGGPP